MGLLVWVHRSSLGDCTGGGESARVDRFCVTNLPGPFEPTKDAPGARIVEGPGYGPKPHNNPILIPNSIPQGTHSMFGGNLAFTSDSRFRRRVGELGGGSGGICIHDRVER